LLAQEKRSKMINANRLRVALLVGLMVACALAMYAMALVSSLDTCKRSHSDLVDREGDLAVRVCSRAFAASPTRWTRDEARRGEARQGEARLPSEPTPTQRQATLHCRHWVSPPRLARRGNHAENTDRLVECLLPR